MKKLFLVLTALSVAPSAFALQEQVCSASVMGRDQSYIVINRDSGQTIYARAERIVASDGGPTLLNGYAIDSHDRFPSYEVEKNFQLYISGRGEVKTGALYIDGKEIGSVELRPVAHTAEVKPVGTVMTELCGYLK